MTRPAGSLSTPSLGRLLALALVLGGSVSDAAYAGTGRLLSKWMNRAPAVDGRLTTGDWDDAAFGQIAPGLVVAFGNDARTLYLLVLDGGNSAVGPGGFVVVHFDDEGGSGQVQDDGAWLNSGCQTNPATGEANLLVRPDGSGRPRPPINRRDWIRRTSSRP